MKKIITVVFSLFLIASCTKIYTKALGFKKITKLNDDQISKTMIENGVNSKWLFQIDTSYIKTISTKLDTSIHKKKYALKIHLQPVHVFYYNLRKRKYEATLANCDADIKKGINLTWASSMTTFPPSNLYDSDTLSGINNIIECARPLRNNLYSLKDSLKNYDYLVMIFWNKWTGRQSKNLLKEVSDNLKMTNTKTLSIYVNMDNFYAEGAKLNFH